MGVGGWVGGTEVGRRLARERASVCASKIYTAKFGAMNAKSVRNIEPKFWGGFKRKEAYSQASDKRHCTRQRQRASLADGDTRAIVSIRPEEPTPPDSYRGPPGAIGGRWLLGGRANRRRRPRAERRTPAPPLSPALSLSLASPWRADGLQPAEVAPPDPCQPARCAHVAAAGCPQRCSREDHPAIDGRCSRGAASATADYAGLADRLTLVEYLVPHMDDRVHLGHRSLLPPPQPLLKGSD
eukprot:scaffold138702_cov33-Tisochrysis_lutea.AAC.1